MPNAGVYLKIVNLESESNITLRERIYADFREGMIGAADFRPKFALIITWRNMTMVNKRPQMPLVVEISFFSFSFNHSLNLMYLRTYN